MANEYLYFFSDVGVPLLAALLVVGALTGFAITRSSPVSRRLLHVAAIPWFAGVAYVIWLVGYPAGSVLTRFAVGFLMTLPAIAVAAACALLAAYFTRARYYAVALSIVGAFLSGPAVVRVGIASACSLLKDCI